MDFETSGRAPGKPYPFVTRRQVADRLAVDADFVRRCVRLLHERTLSKSGGFMASHLHKATRLVSLLDEYADAALLEEARWVSAYARSLSRILREEQLQADPALAAHAAVFGVSPVPRVPAQEPRPAAPPPQEPAAAAPAPRRRPGRPRKHAPDEAPKATRRRRGR